MADIAELRALTEEDLLTQSDEAREELLNLRFQVASGQLENTSRVGVVRRNIARIKTVLRERQLATQLLEEESHAK